MVLMMAKYSSAVGHVPFSNTPSDMVLSRDEFGEVPTPRPQVM